MKIKLPSKWPRITNKYSKSVFKLMFEPSLFDLPASVISYEKQLSLLLNLLTCISNRLLMPRCPKKHN